ncbi:lipid A deacylase LpxR family protein [Spirosoma soli]|uniref:Lipid A deacylase LpxR family protein n=1 Tax=Spirosoma soli TaxID=1770529 RepID=A0ABW5M8V6_9BACT
MKRIVMFTLSWLLVIHGLAQRNQLQLIRISEDNDALNVRRESTDREYTNGTRIDIFYTKHAKPRLLSALLIPIGSQRFEDDNDPNAIDNLYGVGLTQLMYTPSDITQENVIRQSRPYTGVLYATHSLISSDPIHKQRLTTELGLGVLGKAALGKEVQTWFHEKFGFDKPRGWQHQLPTDVVINYLIVYEKALVQPSPNLEIIGLLSTNVGSLSNNINAGITFRAGIFGNYFSNFPNREAASQPGKRPFQFYFFMRPVGRLVMDDAVLQGGFFTHNSAEHVIDRDLLNRGYMQFEYGVVLSRNRLGISFSEKLITAQYNGAPSQQVGNLTFSFGL